MAVFLTRVVGKRAVCLQEINIGKHKYVWDHLMVELQVTETRAGSAQANIEKVGDFAASGFIFKDNVDIIVIEDPEVRLFLVQQLP